MVGVPQSHGDQHVGARVDGDGDVSSRFPNSADHVLGPESGCSVLQRVLGRRPELCAGPGRPGGMHVVQQREQVGPVFTDQCPGPLPEVAGLDGVAVQQDDVGLVWPGSWHRLDWIQPQAHDEIRSAQQVRLDRCAGEKARVAIPGFGDGPLGLVGGEHGATDAGQGGPDNPRGIHGVQFPRSRQVAVLWRRTACTSSPRSAVCAVVEACSILSPGTDRSSVRCTAPAGGRHASAAAASTVVDGSCQPRTPLCLASGAAIRT